ncbi:MAG TPA: PH domain-containing protein [Candidatus Krumholzibacteria bacterium]|nr:PH domain-containing protein [Candidatus Krumholzibacteria bacterium]
MKSYSAPWGKLLIGLTAFSTLICVGVSVGVGLNVRSIPETEGVVRAAAALPMLVVVIAALFMVRGYVVTADEIVVQRPLWSSRFERARLQSAAIDPDALRGSIRLFGNGGLFSFTGWFRSPQLGRYRAYVTDPSRTVILRFADRIIVVSPSDPAAFVRDVTPRG